ncbi:scarecrow-like protein 11 [Tripterygium wilfordii]|uniref:Scarecrow-like protein 11 n=2 Tax=Tripterygium wilfordii TaxID=458696 RepID=A0A7J7DDY8_TRIWF|nr:scarecrow-like protein 11 [Tripterygium wilfordii]
MLMEEDLDDMPCMLQNSLALLAAEQSFYNALGDDNPLLLTEATPSSDLSTIIDTSNYAVNVSSTIAGENDNTEYNSSRSKSRGSRHHRQDYCLEEGRRNKHVTIHVEEPEKMKILDDSLCPFFDSSRELKQPKISIARKKKHDEVVDLWTPLTQCAQAVASFNQRTAYDLLKHIRLHSSPYGDGDQRLAHYFANGLEARLDGRHTTNYKASAAEIIKAYKAYVSISPFRRMSNFFANRTIAKVAANTTRLHIIDFGISYGIQWPCFIQRMSTRPGGPPRIRITGIDLPQPGFRPAERVEETGCRLKRHSERFNVPFEYNVIAQKWETIQYEDLKIEQGEVVVVNCMYRLRNIPDETVLPDSPRDAVLKLIKQINPAIFVHGVVNGGYNSPFFTRRFQEALSHFSSMFDIFEANLPREDEGRMLFEREMLGRDVMNVIACEGTQRVERPESYKKWQARILSAGFEQLPLDQTLMKRLRNTAKENYHKDFVVDEDGHWMLQEWKGRIIQAVSVWKPVQDLVHDELD